MTSDSPPQLRLVSPLVIVLLVFVAAAGFSVGLFPIRDAGDQWWHLKTGKYLIEAGFDFPEEDVFSWTSQGHPWANHEWLADTLMYLGYSAFGLRTLIVLKALILSVTFLLVAGLIYRRTGRGDWAAAGALLATWASQYSVHLRPPVLTYLMTAAYLHLLLNLEQGRRVRLTQALSFPLMVLWVNLHGGAIVGLVLAGLSLGGALLAWAAARMRYGPGTQGREVRDRAGRYGWNLGIVIVASLCNPFTYHIHLLTLKVMRNPELTRFVSELQPPDLHHTKGYLLLLILLVGFSLAAIRRVRAADALLVLFFLHQSLQHVRHLPLFAVVVTPILFEIMVSWHEQLRSGAGKSAPWLHRAMQWVLIALVFLGAITLVAGRWRTYTRPFLKGPGYVRQGTPADAVDFLLHHNFKGKMYNPINFAGYLIWRLSPERFQTFTDSRFDIFGSDVLFDCLAIDAANTLSPEEYNLPSGQQELLRWQIERGELAPYWKRALDAYEVNFLMLGRDSRLHLLLSGMAGSGWIKVYEDAGYSIYLRDVPENEELVQAARSSYEALRQVRSAAVAPLVWP